ncbi:MAG: hypothetical protein DUD34_00960 [Lactobacillus sp.]|nr:MAG: hypothetical protein DUD34_00960 [Lactobacillus sp.]
MMLSGTKGGLTSKVQLNIGRIRLHGGKWPLRSRFCMVIIMITQNGAGQNHFCLSSVFDYQKSELND